MVATADDIDLEIRSTYLAMGTDLCRRTDGFDRDSGKWQGLSQYGVDMRPLHASREQAEKFVLSWYAARMNLIRQ